MADFTKLTFLPLQVEIEAYRKRVVDEVEKLVGAESFFSAYQSCQMIPLWTSGGYFAEADLVHKNLPYMWTGAARSLPACREFVEAEVFPRLEGVYRVILLVTEPGEKIKVHADCNYDRIDELQHKLRFAFSGAIDGLWFLNSNLEKVYVKGGHRVYLLDGSHPHGADNFSQDMKITMCIGSPWSGQLHGPFLDLMHKSAQVYREDCLWRLDIGRPVIRDIFVDRVKQGIQGHSIDPRDQIP